MDFNQSEQINELATALSAFQGEISSIPKNNTVSIPTKNGKFNFKYADLADIWNAIRGPLSKHGLSLVQMITKVDNRSGILTQLMHSSGQYLKTLVPFDTIPGDIKQFGANITYYRRYCLSSMLGIVSEDDVDSALEDDEAPKRKESSKVKKLTITEEQARFLEITLNKNPKVKETVMKNLMPACGVVRLNDLTIEDYDRVLSYAIKHTSEELHEMAEA